MRTKPRRRVFIDRGVQGTLALRVCLYWLLLLSGMFLLLITFPFVVSCLVVSPGAPTLNQIVGQTLRTYWPMAFAAALMLPLIVLDVIRVSHRFAGPVYRFRQALRDVALGKTVAPIELRSDDFWGDLAVEFNAALVRLQAPTPAKPVTSDPKQPTTDRPQNLAV